MGKFDIGVNQELFDPEDITGHIDEKSYLKYIRKFQGLGHRYGDEISDQIMSDALDILTATARAKNWEGVLEDLAESDAFYEITTVLAQNFIDGIEDNWIGPIQGSNSR